VNYTLQEWQWLILTHDGLVGYKRVGGPEGTKKVPDLATAIPKPTDNGKTWAFTLRSGIKFSNGNAVTGKDVKATFERLFKIGNSPNAGSWYNVIVGGDALSDLLTWREPERLLELATLVVVSRPNVQPVNLAQLSAQLPALSSRLTQLAGPQFAVSGTEIRQRVGQGLPIRYQVPEAVWTYITEHGLYRL
jgi:hypothetical protein